ncbi:hypothetical protein MJO28_010118 [Puccinia striiformis f. sp. tritici]|uniref:Uncharacterized protein n=2 Tax=Puccinia striiformis TaxID=27350 RepID=A0A2S4VA34_9BASI|nr:hypothetical protein Pst134EA_018934 [Puccinia striiformis f. sp. tritici]KAI9615631.1 hypothetical protein H4Q26_011573 [Puccinia striiformis f. sp. tritici PST-130]POW06358.1 hypothetical protein PSTT_09038 [Puccinia striiformis]KAH9448986.1 hypothetical protein Pst134EB_019827 [Puccinia striiformis f. sp. tritici]KAH9458778.1 hypothetical protein Pst134EA_018934 [Puccinia striiformis f. sp. tritici]KAI7944423.1 hypothetical protein MJO28_010118 [Puccinia striiformis f. sp. tritici]
MQLFNMLQFMMVLLLQQEATFAKRFGCQGHVKDKPISVCVAMLTPDPVEGPIVNVMTSPWDNHAGAYDCSRAPTGHKRPSCCPEANKFMLGSMSAKEWKRSCKNIDGTDIKY